MENRDRNEELAYETEEKEKLTEERILQMLDERKYKELKEELENMYPVDLAELMEDFSQKQLVMVFRLLAKEEAAETFTEMDSDMREMLIGGLTDSELEEVMEEMYLDDTVDVLEEMPANVVDRLLMATDEETRQQINQLLQYPEDSAGSVMNVDYIALRREMTVADSILKIRQVGLNKETIYTCYVTEKRKLIGMVDVKELLTTGESRTIEEIMDTNVLYAHTTDDQEEVAQIINKYGLIALPIVDHEMCMVGIVTVDDAMDVLQEETTEDISIMAGVNPSDDSYFETTVVEHVKSRLPWLLFLMLSATVTQMIMNHYESALAVMPQLAGFIPMLTGTGGNCEGDPGGGPDQPDPVCRERDPHPCHGPGGCAGGPHHRAYHGLHHRDRQGGGLHPAPGGGEDRPGPGHHGHAAHLHAGGYQHDQRVFRHRQRRVCALIRPALPDNNLTGIVRQKRHQIAKRTLVCRGSLYYNENSEKKWKGVFQSWDL